jgi:Zn-dependent protease with chaperone function
VAKKLKKLPRFILANPSDYLPKLKKIYIIYIMMKIKSKLFLFFSTIIFFSSIQPMSNLLNYNLANNYLKKVDLTDLLRIEFRNFKINYKKIRKQKEFSERYQWIMGYYKINPTNTPLLYNLVENMAAKFEISMPEIYVFRSNVYNDLSSYMFGGDYKCNAWVSTGLKKHSEYLCIGEDLIDNLTYDEIKAVISHEFSHIINGHLSNKTTVLRVIFGAIGLTVGILITPLIPFAGISPAINVASIPIKIGINPLAIGISYTTQLPAMGFSQKLEKQADLTAFETTKDYENLISALEKIEDTYKNKHPYWSKFSKKVVPMNGHPTTKKRASYLKKSAENSKIEADIHLHYSPK